jgi:hypothetical protein
MRHCDNLSLKNIKGEFWKDIPDFEGKYQVSNKGRIKSLKRIINCRWGENHNCKERILKLETDKDGYKIANLKGIDKINKKKVHRLVAFAFIPNPDNLPEVNHKKGDKWDNRDSQLEWSTTKDNMKHSFRVLLRKPTKYWVDKKGKDNPKSKKIEQINMNGQVIKMFYGANEAQRMTGIDHRAIALVAKGKRKEAGGYLWKYA